VPLDPEKRQAYEKAEYVVLGGPEIVLRIGEPNAGLDALLEEHGASTAAFISAANPFGAPASESENDVAFKALSHLAGDYLCFDGEGRDPDPDSDWPPERSLLVLDIPREEAARVARAFEQNAIVYVEKGRAPELVVLV
jgi:hypothetical protein